MIVPFIAAWCGHTDASREMALDIARALDGIGLKHEAAADLMGLGREDFSKQLAGVKPLNLWRLTALPAEFWVGLLVRRSARIGAAVLTPEQVALMKGAAAMGSRRMARMLLPNVQDKRRVG